MFCPKCGAQTGDGSAFCNSCGAPLKNTAPVPPPQQQNANQYYTAPSQAPGNPPQGYYNQPSQQGYYNQPGQQGYYQPAGYGQTQVMTAPKKSSYKIVGIITVAAIVIIIAVVALLIFKPGGGSIVGTWVFPGYEDSMSITFKSNGTLVASSYGVETTSKYKVSGKTLTVIDSSGTASSGDFRIFKQNGKTTLEVSYEGASLTLVRK